MRYKKQIGVGDVRLGKKEKQYLRQVIKTGRLSYGPFSQKFERLFAELHDCRYAIFCNSGTSALHLSLSTLKEKYQWKDGDEVIIPAITFVATGNIVLHNQMKPVFVDVDSKIYNINPSQVEEKITRRTRAIIPVHLLGLPCEMDPLLSICKKYKLKMIEDSCETMFASYRGRKVGSFGELACFSTYIAHYIVTGTGGLVTTNDRKLSDSVRSLMNHGRDLVYFNIDDNQKVRKGELQNIVSKRFLFNKLGYNFRVTELEAAMGLAQLEAKDEIIRKRKANASFLIRELKNLEEFIQLPYVPPQCDHVFMLFPIVLRNENKRNLVNYLEWNAIETRDLLPIINQPVYRKLFGNLEKRYPVAKWLNESGFYIGCHQHLGEKQLEYVVERLHRYFSS